MAVESNNNVSDVINLNNQRYSVTIYLINSTLRLKIPAGTVNELIITESLNSIFSTGVLSINNTGNILENFVSDTNNELNEKTSSQAYMFNSDGKDIFYISVKPLDINEANNSTFPNTTWELKGYFSIYDEEEMIDNAGGIKTKIFYIRDIREQLLYETTPQWSTTQPLLEKYKNKINVSQTSNELRSVPTGTAIKHFLKATLPFFVNDSSFASDWSEGASKVFYTATANDTAYDVLEYLLDQHVSEREDPCILIAERDDTLSLRSLETYFQNAYNKDTSTIGNYVIDAFSITTASTPHNVNTANIGERYNLPAGVIHQFDGLTNFSYLNTTNADSSLELTSICVHNYNFLEKQFNINCKENHILSARKKFQELYVSKVPGKSPQTIIPLNNFKISNKTIKNVYSTETSRVNMLVEGRNRIINKTLSLAPCISFDITGSTARKPGRFVIMFLNDNDSSSSFGKIFPGEWLMTNVHHTFLIRKGIYQNTVTCVKPFSIDPIIPEETFNQYQEFYDTNIREV